MRGIFDGDGVGLNVDDAALSVVSVSREFLHVLLLCVGRELLSLPLD